MPNVPTTRDAGAPIVPPEVAPIIVGTLTQALDMLEATVAIVDAYSQLYDLVVEPHFGDTGDDCPEGRQVEQTSGVGLIADIMAEAAEVITERLGGTGSRGLAIDQYRAEVAEVVDGPPLSAVMAELAEVDPQAHARILATGAAVLAGGPIPCPLCEQVAPDSAAWRAHVALEHPQDAA